MERISIKPRNNWQKIVEDMGMTFHTKNGKVYWDESVAYKFTTEEIDKIKEATEECWQMILEGVQHVIKNSRYAAFDIPDFFIEQIEKSWHYFNGSVYGRFDFLLRDGEVKMLEFNGDTPTTLFETATVQRDWIGDYDNTARQFNSINEKLLIAWRKVKKDTATEILHLACIKDDPEGMCTIKHLALHARKAGINTKIVFIEDIGWNRKESCFVDNDNLPIVCLFKLYPYEWIIKSPFGKNIPVDRADCIWIEPAWKLIATNKALLPILWELFPENPFLLKTYYEPGDLKSYVKKPFMATQGLSIELVTNGEVVQSAGGSFKDQPCVYQEFFEPPVFNGKYPVIGSWIIGFQSSGIGVRESDTLITNNDSRFVPHFIK